MTGRPSAWRLMLSGNDVRLDDAYSGVRYELDAVEAARLITHPEQSSLVSELDQAVPATADVWMRSKWAPSLQYFLWARRALFERAARQVGKPSLVPNISLAHLLSRRTHRTYKRNLVHFPDSTALQPLFDFLTDCDLPRGVSTHALIYEGTDGKPTLISDHGAVRLHNSSEVSRAQMVDAMAGMSSALTAAITIIFVYDLGDLNRSNSDDYTPIDIFVELGRIAQLLVLIGESGELGALVTPGFSDSAIGHIFQLREGQVPLYSVTLGSKTSQKPSETIQ